jgi:phosphatidylinositol alpha-1,6-mannosyltransferase
VEAVDHIVTGSEFSRRQMAGELGVRVDHVSVVPYGIEEKFRPGPRREDLIARHGLAGRRVALFVGGLKPRKNLPRLLEMWRAVAAERPDACLLIAGGGPLRAALDAQAAQLGLGDRVVFAGYVPEVEKADYYRLADVFVFPSGLEGFGLAIGEAMSTGIPVVASDRGSIPELVADGQTGVLADPDRIDTFVRPVVGLLDDAALRAKLGAAGRERIDRSFRWDRCATDTARVYEDVVARWRAGRDARRRA